MPELSPINPSSDWGPRCDGSDDVGDDIGDLHYTNAHNFADIGMDTGGITYDDGVLMTEIGGDVGSKLYHHHNHLASIGDDAEMIEYLQTYHPGTGAMVAMGSECDEPESAEYGIGGSHYGSRYDDGVLMTQIGYEMYSEYGAHPHQVIPYMGFGPASAQTDYPHGPFDEPDMGADHGLHRGQHKSRHQGHAFGKRR